MQGKESSEPKAKGESSAGIDVCKNWLDAHVLPEGCSLRLANDAKGINRLAAFLTKRGVSLIAMEATGKWHRLAHRLLHARGFRVAVLNPLRARLFAEAIGLLAKTDKLDARMLAHFANSLSPPASPPVPGTIEALKELVAGRDSAVAEHTALQNQLAASTTTFLRRQLKARIERLAKDCDPSSRDRTPDPKR